MSAQHRHRRRLALRWALRAHVRPNSRLLKHSFRRGVLDMTLPAVGVVQHPRSSVPCLRRACLEVGVLDDPPYRLLQRLVSRFHRIHRSVRGLASPLLSDRNRHTCGLRRPFLGRGGRRPRSPHGPVFQGLRDPVHQGHLGLLCRLEQHVWIHVDAERNGHLPGTFAENKRLVADGPAAADVRERECHEGRLPNGRSGDECLVATSRRVRRPPRHTRRQYAPTQIDGAHPDLAGRHVHLKQSPEPDFRVRPKPDLDAGAQDVRSSRCEGQGVAEGPRIHRTFCFAFFLFLLLRPTCRVLEAAGCFSRTLHLEVAGLRLLSGLAEDNLGTWPLASQQTRVGEAVDSSRVDVHRESEGAHVVHGS
mmetsp:Transcript_21189/g.60147  ORF Transcript_21189/g.60147 Transcript_21189/m.60147 type:complete len:363 (-) Transcript_21189:155-1243(-)